MRRFLSEHLVEERAREQLREACGSWQRRSAFERRVEKRSIVWQRSSF